MLLDLFASDNYINVNTNIARVFDLNTAVYSSLLLSIYKKAFKKKKLIEGKYFKLDRNYVKTMTTLSRDAQLVCDVALMSAHLMEKPEDDVIYLNVDEFIAVVSETDKDVVKSIKEEMKNNLTKYKQEKSEAKKQTTLDKMMEFVYYDNDELRNAMKDWIVHIARRFGYSNMNKELIFEFERKLDGYTKGDLDIALRLIEIASTQSLRELQWAINVYEAENRKNRQSNKPQTVRTTIQDVATRGSVNADLIF